MGAAGDEETGYFGFTVDPAILVEATNVLAIEVHQATADSSDLGMDAVVRVDRPVPSSKP